MKATLPPCLADRPNFASYLDALPDDPERDRLTAHYRQLTTTRTALAERQSQIDVRLRELTADLVNVNDGDRAKLLKERASLRAEADVLEEMRPEAARQYAEALTAWCRVIRRQLESERQTVIAALNDIGDRMVPHLRLIQQCDDSVRVREAHQTAYDEAQKQLTALRRERTPLAQREEHLRQLVSYIDVTIANHFGDDARQSGPTPRDVARFVARVSRPAA